MWNPFALRMDRRHSPNLVVGAVHKVQKVALSYLYPDAAPHDGPFGIDDQPGLGRTG